MSLEEEVTELSVVYHSQRERMQELEQLVEEYHALVAQGLELPPPANQAVWEQQLADIQQRATKYIAKMHSATSAVASLPFEEIEATIRQLLTTLPENYPVSELKRNSQGEYTLIVGRSLIFHRASVTEALERVTRYVKEREGHPTLPVGVIDGIYD